ncbi:FolC bifunctional protein [Pseudovirgaria hyperparasitica]|uniref:Dihydrofolate synthetase n=1 Tax=Pseudovirgaria hyperparasitica TaxID=470096 RepID=A0A6A6W9Q5_9PEZI|nr:FolC bifunctional protein [Pseudovirgaria hyperparasitica]KAF2759582.1 FolC bifunctional protein [Pseudovirgaria hyperparasitica]
MIQPGLERIHRLLANTPLTWKAIHVAGTNGKGSICAALSAMLHASGVRCGRFTSPHLIDRWDCINISETPVTKKLFQQVEADLRRLDQEHSIKASEFELLTATAFRIFNSENLDFAVVEVGMGGLLDATNIITKPSVTIISKISLDHQNFLGNTVEEIAFQKAGIIKRGVPCIVDGNNTPTVLDVIRKQAMILEAPLIVRKSLPHFESNDQHWKSFKERKYLQYQSTNLGLAYQALVTAYQSIQQQPPSPSILGTIPPDHWPGRTQNISIQNLTERENPVLIDGAHNVDSALVLKQYVPEDRPVTWLVSMSQGKNSREILKHLLRDGDSLVAVKFGAVDGMPWVKAMEPKELCEVAGQVASLSQLIDGSQDVHAAIHKAAQISQEGNMIITGSLYLVSDVLRLKRDHSVSGALPATPTFGPEHFMSNDIKTWRWD